MCVCVRDMNINQARPTKPEYKIVKIGSEWNEWVAEWIEEEINYARRDAEGDDNEDDDAEHSGTHNKTS